MGSFKAAVQENQFPGPFSRKFDLKRWSAANVEDKDDVALRDSGLLIASQLTSMRPHSAVQGPDQQVLMALVGHANQIISHMHHDLFKSIAVADAHGPPIDALLFAKNDTGATLSESTDALGDSLVYPLRVAMDLGPDRVDFANRNRWKELSELTDAEMRFSNIWYLTWLHWMDALWLGASLTQASALDWQLKFPDHEKEAIRQIGAWRRTRFLEHIASDALPAPLDTFGTSQLTVECRRVGDRVLLGARPVRPGEKSWSESIRGYAVLPQLLYSARLLSVELLIGTNRLIVRDVISLYSTFISLFFEFLKFVPPRTGALHPRDVVRVSMKNLVETISQLANIPREATKALLELATFRGKRDESLWGRPLIFAGTDDRFVFMPALKSSLLRTLTDVVDGYAADHGCKGAFFQEHVRDRLRVAIKDSHLSELGWVSPRPVDTKVSDIDVCVTLGATLVVIEVKFIGNAIDAYEHWRADQRFAEAVSQLTANIGVVMESPESFATLLSEKYGAPKSCTIDRVIPLIVSSDSYHAGFTFDNVPVADMEILEFFFANRLTAWQSIAPAKPGESSPKLYETPAAAIEMLQAYLLEPTQIAMCKKALIPRVLAYPTGLGEGANEIKVTATSVEVCIP